MGLKALHGWSDGWLLDGIQFIVAVPTEGDVLALNRLVDPLVFLLVAEQSEESGTAEEVFGEMVSALAGREVDPANMENEEIDELLAVDGADTEGYAAYLRMLMLQDVVTMDANGLVLEALEQSKNNFAVMLCNLLEESARSSGFDPGLPLDEFHSEIYALFMAGIGQDSVHEYGSLNQLKSTVAIQLMPDIDAKTLFGAQYFGGDFVENYDNLLSAYDPEVDPLNPEIALAKAYIAASKYASTDAPPTLPFETLVFFGSPIRLASDYQVLERTDGETLVGLTFYDIADLVFGLSDDVEILRLQVLAIKLSMQALLIDDSYPYGSIPHVKSTAAMRLAKVSGLFFSDLEELSHGDHSYILDELSDAYRERVTENSDLVDPRSYALDLFSKIRNLGSDRQKNERYFSFLEEAIEARNELDEAIILSVEKYNDDEDDIYSFVTQEAVARRQMRLYGASEGFINEYCNSYISNGSLALAFRGRDGEEFRRIVRAECDWYTSVGRGSSGMLYYDITDIWEDEYARMVSVMARAMSYQICIHYMEDWNLDLDDLDTYRTYRIYDKFEKTTTTGSGRDKHTVSQTRHTGRDLLRITGLKTMSYNALSGRHFDVGKSKGYHTDSYLMSGNRRYKAINQAEGRTCGTYYRNFLNYYTDTCRIVDPKSVSGEGMQPTLERLLQQQFTEFFEDLRVETADDVSLQVAQSLVPFWSMAENIKAGNVEGAILDGYLDVITFIPVGAGARTMYTSAKLSSTASKLGKLTSTTGKIASSAGKGIFRGGKGAAKFSYSVRRAAVKTTLRRTTLDVLLTATNLDVVPDLGKISIRNAADSGMRNLDIPRLGRNKFEFVEMADYYDPNLMKRLSDLNEQASGRMKYVEEDLQHAIHFDRQGKSVSFISKKPDAQRKTYFEIYYRPDNWIISEAFRDPLVPFYMTDVVRYQYEKAAELGGFQGSLPKKIVREQIINPATKDIIREYRDTPDFMRKFMEETVNGKSSKRIMDELGLEADSLEIIEFGNMVSVAIHTRMKP
jgi:hypothetical protein